MDNNEFRIKLLDAWDRCSKRDKDKVWKLLDDFEKELQKQEEEEARTAKLEKRVSEVETKINSLQMRVM